MLVYALRRFGSHGAVAPALREFVWDADLVLHAVSAYRRVAGTQEALELAREVADADPLSPRGKAAAREVAKVERALAKRGANAER